MDSYILRLPEVVAKTGLSRSTIYAQIAKGEFPQGIRLGDKARGWLSDELNAWINEKVALREAGHDS